MLQNEILVLGAIKRLLSDYIYVCRIPTGDQPTCNYKVLALINIFLGAFHDLCTKKLIITKKVERIKEKIHSANSSSLI